MSNQALPAPPPSSSPPPPQRFRGRFHSYFLSFLGGLTVAGLYAGFRLKDDLGGFEKAIGDLQSSVDDVGRRLSQVKQMERALADLRKDNDAQRRRVAELENRVRMLEE